MASISKKTTASSNSDALLRAAVLNAVRLSEQRNIPRFLGFLDEYQRQQVQTLLDHEHVGRCLFYGGFTEAERTYLGLFPENEEPAAEAFPITALAFRYRAGIPLNHRDFLGTLLSCGVKREKIGDILCSDGFSVAFIDKEISHYLALQITKIGGEGVSLLENYTGDLPSLHNYKDIHDTIASPRLDAVIKVAVGISREEASRRIEAGQVSVNHIPCVSIAKNVREKDVLSVRGTGRFVIDALGPVTKKGRLFITIKKYL